MNNVNFYQRIFWIIVPLAIVQFGWVVVEQRVTKSQLDRIEATSATTASKLEKIEQSQTESRIQSAEAAERARLAWITMERVEATTNLLRDRVTRLETLRERDREQQR